MDARAHAQSLQPSRRQNNRIASLDSRVTDIFKTQVGKWCRSCAKRRRELLHLERVTFYLDAGMNHQSISFFRSVTTQDPFGN